MITRLYALYPLLGPQGSRSVCLGTFSLAAFGGSGWEKHHHHPQNPQQRMRAGERDNLQGCNIIQERGAPKLDCGESCLGRPPKVPTEVFAECVLGSA